MENVSNIRSRSVIYTLYSFKGGVGRSMALANLAELLYQQGLRVLMVDFDLEAPGLERFFGAYEPDLPDKMLDMRGIIDMLVSFKALRPLPLDSKISDNMLSGITFEHPIEPITNFLYPIYPDNSQGGALYLMPAGRRASDQYVHFSERVRTFDWDDFYQNWDGEKFFDWFRQEVATVADVVLIDSRTGITEMTGVCTFHLADIVVIFLAPNYQNLEGACLIAESLSKRKRAREKASQTIRTPLEMLLVPSRVDISESDKLGTFKDEFEKKVSQFISSKLSFENNPFDDLKIPYIPRYAFFENLAAREPNQPVAADAIAAYKRLAAAMWQLAPSDSIFYRRYYQKSNPEAIQAVGGTVPMTVMEFVGREWIFDAVNAWIESGGSRSFLILGEPGCGKTALSRRFIQMSQGDIPTTSYPALGPGSFQYAHFCSARDTSSLDPFIFMQNLAQHLSRRYPEFAQAIVQSNSQEITIDARQTIGSVQDGTKVVGIQIDNLQIGKLSLETAFNKVIIRPIFTLLSVKPNEAITILIDGLDEAVNFASKRNFINILDVDSGQLIQSLEGHPDGIISIAITPDGRRILSGSYDHSIRVWDALVGQLIRPFVGHFGAVTAIMVSPNGRFIVSGSDDKTVKVWDAATGQMTLSLEGHTDTVTAVAVSRDSKFIVSGSSDSFIKIWDSESGIELRTLHGHTNWVTSIAISPDGNRIVSGSSDKTIRIWEVKSGRELISLVGHTNAVTAVAISPDGNRVVSGSSDMTIKIWDAAMGKELVTLLGHSDVVTAVAIFRDGNSIVSGSSDKSIMIWDVTTGKLMRFFESCSGWVSALTISPDGRRIICGLSGNVLSTGETIVSLLDRFNTLPKQVRLLLLSRPDPRILSTLQDYTPFTLDSHQPELQEDVRSYVKQRLAVIPQLETKKLIDKISTLSEGNILYARFITEDAIDNPNEIDKILNETLPTNLNKLYRKYVEQAIGIERDGQPYLYYFLLNIIAVAFAPLTTSQLTGILKRSKSETVVILQAWLPYLDGSFPEGPYKLFHASFRDFILTNKEYNIQADDAHFAIADYYLREYTGSWASCQDEYALRYTPKHLIEALKAATEKKVRADLEQTLITLLTDPSFLEAKATRFGRSEVVEDLQNAPANDAILGNLGLSYYNLGQMEKAIESHSQALDMARKEKNLYSEGIHLSNLGLAHIALGNYELAIKCYDQSLIIAREIGDGVSESNALINMGLVYSDLGNMAKAIEYNLKALDICKAIYDNMHPNVALVYSNLGLAWINFGDSKKAIECFDKALEIDLIVYGNKHPYVAESYTNLGFVWNNQGDVEKAIEYYERALAIDQAVFGDKNLNVARDFNDLGLLLQQINKMTEARKYFEQALEIYIMLDDQSNVNIVRQNLSATTKPKSKIKIPKKKLISINQNVEFEDFKTTKSIVKGRGASSTVLQGIGRNELEKLLIKIYNEIDSQNDNVLRSYGIDIIESLKNELAKGSKSEDKKIALFVEDLISKLPNSKSEVIQLFSSSRIAANLGPVTKYVLDKISE